MLLWMQKGWSICQRCDGGTFILESLTPPPSQSPENLHCMVENLLQLKITSNHSLFFFHHSEQLCLSQKRWMLFCDFQFRYDFYHAKQVKMTQAFGYFWPPKVTKKNRTILMFYFRVNWRRRPLNSQLSTFNLTRTFCSRPHHLQFTINNFKRGAGWMFNENLLALELALRSLHA